MIGNEQNQRWYDQDPTVSIAVSILRNANQSNQKLVADFLLLKSKELNINLPETKPRKITLFPRRWYDFDDRVFKALEFLKACPSELQKELAIDIINYLCDLDSAVSKEKA